MSWRSSRRAASSPFAKTSSARHSRAAIRSGSRSKRGTASLFIRAMPRELRRLGAMHAHSNTEDPVRTARVDLAAAHRMAVFDHLNEGTWNHFSVAVPDDPGRMLVTPAG